VTLFAAHRASTVVLYRFAIRPRVWPSPTTWILSADAGALKVRSAAITAVQTSSFELTIRREGAIEVITFGNATT